MAVKLVMILVQKGFTTKLKRGRCALLGSSFCGMLNLVFQIYSFCLPLFLPGKYGENKDSLGVFLVGGEVHRMATSKVYCLCGGICYFVRLAWMQELQELGAPTYYPNIAAYKDIMAGGCPDTNFGNHCSLRLHITIMYQCIHHLQLY